MRHECGGAPRCRAKAANGEWCCLIAHGLIGYAIAGRKIAQRPAFNRVKIVPHKFARKFQINGKAPAIDPDGRQRGRARPAITKNRPRPRCAKGKSAAKELLANGLMAHYLSDLTPTGLATRSGAA